MLSWTPDYHSPTGRTSRHNARWKDLKKGVTSTEAVLQALSSSSDYIFFHLIFCFSCINPGIMRWALTSVIDKPERSLKKKRNLIWMKRNEKVATEYGAENADSWIINIYIYIKSREDWIFGSGSVYACWSLIVMLLQPERQTVNKFWSEYFNGHMKESWRRSASHWCCEHSNSNTVFKVMKKKKNYFSLL